MCPITAATSRSKHLYSWMLCYVYEPLQSKHSVKFLRYNTQTSHNTRFHGYIWVLCFDRIIIGSDRRHETKQGIEGKIVRFRSGGLGIGLVLGIRIADLNQIAGLKLPILVPVKFRSPI